MKKLIVIALVTLLGLGLTVGAASAWDWESRGNARAGSGFTASTGAGGGSNFGSYYVNTGILVGDGHAHARGRGDSDEGGTMVWGRGSEGIYAWQELTHTFTLDPGSPTEYLVTAYMYSDYEAQGGGHICRPHRPGPTQMYQTVGRGGTQDQQYLNATGSGSGHASMYTLLDDTIYGVLGMQVASTDYWNVNAWQIVDYSTGDTSGYFDGWLGW